MKASALLAIVMGVAVLSAGATAKVRTLHEIFDELRQRTNPKHPPHQEPVPTAQPEPPTHAPEPPVIETKKPEPEQPKGKKIIVTKKQPERKKVAARGMPPCSVVRREYERMSIVERLVAYHSATAEEVAHGKKCLGM